MVSRYSNTTGKLITVQENYKLELVQRKYTVVVYLCSLRVPVSSEW